MRTQVEIVDRIKKIEKEDFFGCESGDLIHALAFDYAKAFLKPEVTTGDWKPTITSDADARKEIIEYLPFAKEKAENHRGISASRSISHMKAWLWLLGRDDLVAFADDDANYCNYGAPILKKIAEEFGQEFPASGPLARMAQGQRCGEEDGCGCG